MPQDSTAEPLPEETSTNGVDDFDLFGGIFDGSIFEGLEESIRAKYYRDLAIIGIGVALIYFWR